LKVDKPRIIVQVYRIPSRGLTADELLKNTLWWNGPSFIAHPVVNVTEPKDICVDEVEVESCNTDSGINQSRSV